MKTDWTDKIRETLSESTVTPPDGVWAGILSDLDAATHMPQVRRHTGAWRWYAAAACIAALIVCGVIAIIPNLSDATLYPTANIAMATASASDTSATESDTPSAVSSDNDKDIDDTPSAPATTKTLAYKNPRKKADTNTTNTDNYLSINEQEYTSAPDVNEVCEIREGIHDSTLPDSAGVKSPEIEDWPYTNTEESLMAYASDSKRHISFSIYAGSSNSGGKNSGSATNDLFSDVLLGGNLVNGFHGAVSSWSPVSEYSLTEAKHRQPVRFGVSVRLPLTNSFSISAGASYSRLSSSLKYTSETAQQIAVDQTLNYIGIPVSVDYSLPQYSRAGFYLTAGAMAEKCVYGSAKETLSGITERVSEKSPQLSVFAGAGMQVNLNKNLSLYLEPLASYYFDNHSSVINIYKDRQLAFDIRLGLRLTK